MKTKKMKLSFNKTTITTLTTDEQNVLHGGGPIGGFDFSKYACTNLTLCCPISGAVPTDYCPTGDLYTLNGPDC